MQTNHSHYKIVEPGKGYDFENKLKKGTHVGQTLTLGYDEINEMAHKMNAPLCIIARGVRLLEETHRVSIPRRSIEARAAACLYIACRLEKAPRTFKKICAFSGISRKEIGHCFQRIIKVNQMSIRLITTDDFIPRFCAKLGLPLKVHLWAGHIARQAMEIGMVAGRAPISVAARAARAIFMAAQGSDSRKTVKQICDIAGVTGWIIKTPLRSTICRASRKHTVD